MVERTMEELLRAPTEGYGEAIVLPEINADHFEIKTNLLQLVQANPFHSLENENPHARINSFKRITSTLRFRNVPNDVIKLMMFPYSLEGAAKTCFGLSLDLTPFVGNLKLKENLDLCYVWDKTLEELNLSHLVLPKEEFILPSLVSTARVEVSTARTRSELDDLYNNFKIVEQEVKGTASSSSSSSSQNVAFVSSSSSTNEVNTAYGVSTANTQVSPASTQSYEEVPKDMALMAFLDSEPKFDGYGPKTSKSVSKDTSNEVRESPDASLVEELVSNDKHMTCNMSYLSDFKEFDGGYVTFGGGAKGGRITGKGTLKTGKLDFEDVYFVKELQFNLFSVSQISDKKNSVLFTDIGCFVLSPDFKLADESQVLLKVPRKKNMYSVDIKNIIPKESLTCLVAKATLDESMLWHRRLGHVNFKTINKLVKDNLVKGDGPKWLFDIDVLTESMNYVPVVAGTNSNDFVGTKESIGACQSNKETRSSQDYILMPLWKDGSLFDSSSKNANNDEPQPSNDVGKKDEEGVGIEEPKKVIQALKDPSWIEAMQKELLQFKLQQVWTLVDLPYSKRAIGTKWVYRNKKDERGIVIRNKARLVAQGYTQKEGINYDKVFALVARIEAIRLFLACASFKDFVVYQMDLKSAFLYGKIKEEVYVCQPLGFEDPEFPNKVYKVEKALYGLHQAPKAWDSSKKKLIQMIKIHTDHNVADLLTKAFDVGRFQYLIASIGMLNP
ncbi:putative ribonuclease H-like domain-containing protein [Tanacetum coccineum]